MLLGIEQVHLCAVDFLLEAIDLVLKVRVLSRQEILVLIEQINLATESLAVPFNVVLTFLRASKLTLKLLLLAFKLAEVVLELARGLLLSVQLATLLVEQGVLLVKLLVISLKVQVAALKSSNSAIRLIFDLLELCAKRRYLNLVLLQLVLGDFQ